MHLRKHYERNEGVLLKMSALPRITVPQTYTAWVHKRDTPPYSSNMAERGKKRYTAGEVLEAIFDDEDSLDEQFDCGSDVEMVPDSAESDRGSDLDAQITQIISNLEIGETNREHDNTTSFEAVNAPGM